MANPCCSIYIRISITTLFNIWTPSKLNETTSKLSKRKQNIPREKNASSECTN